MMNKLPLLKLKKSLFSILSLGALVGASHAQVVSITPNGGLTTTGGGNYGLQWELASSEGFTGSAYSLNEFTITAGDTTLGGSSTMYVNFYELTSGTADFSSGGAVNANYLGGSTDSVDFGSFSTGADMTWNSFSFDSSLPTDVALFAVFSTTSADGNLIGASIQTSSTSAPTFSNILAADAGPIFGGTGDNAGATQEPLFSADVSVVPEPSLLGFLALASGALLMRRRR
jgi:hypothetical protein